MYDKISKLSETQFRRKTGVKKKTFNKMVGVVKEAQSDRKKLSGRPSKLSYVDRTLIALEYLRDSVLVKSTASAKQIAIRFAVGWKTL